MCENCKDDGYITAEKDGVSTFIGFCACPIGQQKKRESWEYQLTKVGIPKTYWDYHFSDFKEQSQFVDFQQYRNDVRVYLENIKLRREEGALWLIFGAVGTGKTLGASLILKEALKKDYECAYVVWTDLMDGVFKTDEDIVRKLRDVDFLVIDDLGKDKTSKASRFSEDLLEKIVKHRYTNKLPTILVSPTQYAELAARFPILHALLAPINISQVNGLNFRTQIEVKKKK